jgi:ABC-type antimicrobial peptide transport system permease subunit
MSLVVAGDDPDALKSAARAVVASTAPGLAIRRVARLQTLLDEELSAERFAARLLAGFAGLALVLSAVGLYAVLAYRTRSRRRETGIRLALGADTVHVRRRVTLPGLRITLLGVATGGGASAWLAGFLDGVVPTGRPPDPQSFAVAATLLLVVSWLAAQAPARHSSRLDPAAALREE